MADTEPEENKRKFSCAIPTRAVIAILASFALALQYGLRVNLNVIILSMINTTAVKIQQKEEYSVLSKNSDDYRGEQIIFSERVRVDGPFIWNDKIRGVVLSAYFWGYIILQFPGGRLAEVIGTKWVFFASIMMNTLGCLLIPLSAYLHWGLLVAIRIFQGAGGGMLFPTTSVLVSRWAPPNERATMNSAIFSGTGMGTMSFLLASGYLATYLGWEATFYIEGVIGLVWCLIWAIVAADTPAKMKWLISQKERDYILNAIIAKSGEAKPKLKIPWLSIFTSVPFYAILIVNTLYLFGWYCFLVELPNFMNRIMRLPMRYASLASALPYLVMWPFSIIVGRTLDYFQTKEKITCTTARKIAIGIGTIGPAISTGIITFVGNIPFAIFLACITISCGSVCMFSGYLANPIDIAPNFAGTILGITNSIGTIGGIIAPLALGAFLDADDSIRSWRVVFLTLSAFYLLAIIIYVFIGTGEVQPWNDPETTQ